MVTKSYMDPNILKERLTAIEKRWGLLWGLICILTSWSYHQNPPNCVLARAHYAVHQYAF